MMARPELVSAYYVGAHEYPMFLTKSPEKWIGWPVIVPTRSFWHLLGFGPGNEDSCEGLLTALGMVGKNRGGWDL